MDLYRSNVTTSISLIERNVTEYSRKGKTGSDVTLTEEEIEEITRLRTIRMILVVTFIGTYFCVTIVFNALALLILLQKAFMRNAFAIGQRFLAVLDIVLAVTVLLRYFMKGNAGMDITHWNTTVCRVYKTFYYTIVANVNWCIVYLSTVRYLALKYPLKVNSHVFVRRSYMSLIFMSSFVSLFYTLVYHEVTRVFANQDLKASVEECFSYKDFPINQYAFRTLIMSVETILPAIVIVIINTLTYREYRNVSYRRNQLKEAVLKHSYKITQIKSTLTSSDINTRKKIVGILKKSADSYRTNPPDIASVPSSVSNKQSSAGSVSPTAMYGIRRSDSPTAAFQQPEVVSKSQDRDILLQKLKHERLNLRRATRAYVTLRDIEAQSVPKGLHSKTCSSEDFLESDSKEICDVAVTQGDNLPSPEVASSSIPDPHREMRLLLETVTVIFLFLNAPRSIFYIISAPLFNETRVGFESYMLYDVIFTILMCCGHASNSLMYIFSSSKVKIIAQNMLVANKFT